MGPLVKDLRRSCLEIHHMKGEIRLTGPTRRGVVMPLASKNVPNCVAAITTVLSSANAGFVHHIVVYIH